SPVARVRSRASRSACATISTAPERASCVTTVTRPLPCSKSSRARSSMLRSFLRRAGRLHEQEASLLRHPVVGGDRAAPERGPPAAPVREDPAGLLDDGHHGGG